MKITLCNFRCHQKSEFIFSDGKLTLLSGASGAGKSSILTAIYWCLYGSVRGIYNNTNQKSKAYVQLDLGNFTIYRQGNPGLLRVTIYINGNRENETQYEDDMAQQLIDSHYGKKDVWMSCCYIKQGMKCMLLTGSNDIKMDILNSVSFSSDNPEQLIERINTELKSRQDQYKINNAIFTEECNKLNQKMTLNNEYLNIHYTREQVGEIKINIINLKRKLKQLTEVQLNQRELVGKKMMLEQSLCQKKSQLEIIKSSNDISIQHLEIELNYINDKIRELNQRLVGLKQQKSDQESLRQKFNLLTQSVSDKKLQQEQCDIRIATLNEENNHIEERKKFTRQNLSCDYDQTEIILLQSLIEKLRVDFKQLSQTQLLQRELSGKKFMLENSLQQRKNRKIEIESKNILEVGVTTEHLEEELTRLNIEISELNYQFTELNRSKTEQQVLREQRDNLNKILDKKNAEYDEMTRIIKIDISSQNKGWLNKIFGKIKSDEIPTKKIIQDTENELRIKREEREKLNMTITQQEQYKKELDDVIRSIEKNEKELLKYPSVSQQELNQRDEKIKSLEEELSNFTEINNRIKAREGVISNLKPLQNLSQKHRDISINEHELDNINEHEKEYNMNKTIAEEIGITYSEESIKQYIDSLKQKQEFISQIEKKIKVYNSICQLENKLCSFPLNNVTEEEINICKQKYEEMKKGLNLLRCPHCLQTVHYISNELIKGDAECPTNSNELEQLNQDIKLKETQIEQNRRRKYIEEEIQQYPHLTTEDRDNIKNYEQNKSSYNPSKIIYNLSKLNKIVIVKKPELTSELAGRILHYHRLQKELESYRDLSGKKINDTDKLRKELKELRSMTDKYNRDQCYRLILEESINNDNKKMSSIQLKIVPNLDEIKQQSKDIKLYISDLEKKIEMHRQDFITHEKYIMLGNEIDTINQHISQIIIIPGIIEKYNICHNTLKERNQRLEIVKERNQLSHQNDLLQKEIDDLISQINKIHLIDVDSECQRSEIEISNKETELVHANKFIELHIEMTNIMKQTTFLKERYNEIGKEIQLTEKEITQITLIHDINQQYEQCESEIQEKRSQLEIIKTQQQLAQQQEAFQKEIELLTQQINNIVIKPDIDNKCRAREKEVLDNEKELICANKYVEIVKERSILGEKQADIMKLLNDISSIEKLLKTAIDVELNLLQSTVDSINITMAEILSGIFDSPINVMLKLQKQNKTDKRLVNQVNLSIMYRGAEYTGVGDLSGGEADRISLALILALNRVSPAPFLLLDECISSLDEGLRTLCLDVIKRSIDNTKIAIVVSHTDIEGEFDMVVRI